MITILHPTRSRAEKSLMICKSWLKRAGTDDVRIIISVDDDDTTVWKYCTNLHELNFMIDSEDRISIVRGPNKSAVDAINSAADYAIQNYPRDENQIFIVVSDDTDCPDNWAVDLLKTIEGKVDWIAKCPDGIQNWMITMPIMDRVYFNRFGYIYHPGYMHMFCDLEVTCVADLTGRKIDIPMMFRHLHPGHGHGTPDALNARADATWTQGENLFLSRLKKNFDLAETDIVGKITDESYRAWIATKLK